MCIYSSIITCFVDLEFNSKLKWTRVHKSHSIEPTEYENSLCAKILYLMILINICFFLARSALSHSVCLWLVYSLKSHIGRAFCWARILSALYITMIYTCTQGVVYGRKFSQIGHSTKQMHLIPWYHHWPNGQFS